MAGDWLMWQVGLCRKPEVIEMASVLGMARTDVAGRLMAVWEWANEVSANGHAPVRTLSYIDTISGCDGFAECMRSVGWLAMEDGEILFPNWERWNTKSAKRRGLDALRKRRARAQAVRTPSAPRPHGKRTRGQRTYSKAPPSPPEMKEPCALEETLAELFPVGRSPSMRGRIAAVSGELAAMGATVEGIRRTVDFMEGQKWPHAFGLEAIVRWYGRAQKPTEPERAAAAAEREQAERIIAERTARAKAATPEERQAICKARRLRRSQGRQAEDQAWEEQIAQQQAQQERWDKAG